MSCNVLKLSLAAFLFSSSLVNSQNLSVEARPSVTISFPSSRPSNTVTVPGNFVGIGFETAFLNDYSNEFSENLVTSLGNRMSEKPIIRIGGTSGDKVTFDPNQKVDRKCISGSGSCPNGSSAAFILGTSYFEGFKRFQNAQMTFQAPLGKSPVNISNTLDYVRRAYDAVGPGRIDAIAIGNEPNVYDKTVGAYVSAAIEVESNITAALKLSNSNASIFEVSDLSSGSVATQSPWTLEDAFRAGLNSNNLTKLAAAHYYQIDGKDKGRNLQGQLMNHTAIKHKFANHEKALKYLKNNTDVPYVLSETSGAISGVLNFSASFGACLWSVDFQLYTMSKGVARVNGVQRPIANHSLWMPINTVHGGPQVQAPFYALPFVADFIGKTSKAPGVVELDLKSDFLSAYAVYNGNAFARVALINLHEYSPGWRCECYVETLTADAGAEALGFDIEAKQNITWAGEQWSYKVDNGQGHVSGKKSRIVEAKKGQAVISVLDSEAVIVYLGDYVSKNSD